MLLYGTDKPDLRNPLLITDVTAQFAGSGFGLFAKIAAAGGVVRAIPAPGTAANPRSFFDKLNEWAREQGAGGLGYIQFEADGAEGPDRPQPGAGAGRGDPRRLRRCSRATACSSPPASRTRRRNSPARCAPSSARTSA